MYNEHHKDLTIVTWGSLTLSSVILCKLDSCPMPWSFRALLVLALRDSVTRFFASGFFHESVSPKTLIISLGPFRIFFENSRRYSQLKVARKKSSIRKFFMISFGHLWIEELAYKYIFSSSFQVVSSLIIAPVVCRRYQQRKRNWWKNLPPVFVDTGGASWTAYISASFLKTSK